MQQWIPAIRNRQTIMKVYALSLAVGVLVGLIYGLLQVRSPAPPVVALLGLLGILAGEQIPAVVKHLSTPKPVQTSWLLQVKPHMFGDLPCGRPTKENNS
jgi:XapX domain-containing protein